MNGLITFALIFAAVMVASVVGGVVVGAVIRRASDQPGPVDLSEVRRRKAFEAAMDRHPNRRDAS
jgi:hypothetical protein